MCGAENVLIWPGLVFSGLSYKGLNWHQLCLAGLEEGGLYSGAYLYWFGLEALSHTGHCQICLPGEKEALHILVLLT